MLSLFPVQTTNHTEALKTAQWRLINQLLECCQLEQWLAPQKVITTSSRDHLATLFEQQEAAHQAGDICDLLPHLSAPYDHAITEALCQYNAPLVVILLPDHAQLLLLVAPSHCSQWRLKQACWPLLYTPSVTSSNNGNNTTRQRSEGRAIHSHSNCTAQLQVVDSSEQLLSLLLSAMQEQGESLPEGGVLKLQESLTASLMAQQWSAQAEMTSLVYKQEHWYQSLIAAEQWASLTDRPFHPLAKGKLGFTEQDYQHYMAEFDQPIYLNWVAVDKTHLMLSELLEKNNQRQDSSYIETALQPAHYLLNESQKQTLEQELQARGVASSHIAIPIHPWQMTHELDAFFQNDLANKTVVKLRFNQLVSHGSASMRSMLFCSNTPYSIKLPLGVYALNSKRYLPALKLINAEKNQALLVQACQRDGVLKQQMWLWDERLWWGYMSPEDRHDKSSINPSFYQEKPTHLGLLLRCLPKELRDNSVRLLPMASLGMLVHKAGSSHHIFDELIGALQADTAQSPAATAQHTQHNDSQGRQACDAIQTQVMTCFTSLCYVFLGTMLRCIRLGFIPELHGQNVVIVIKDHQFSGVLLRDHDSVRIHLPWLNRHQIDDPHYLSPPNFKNRLYREAPQALIFYLQSLGILVNLRAIIESLAAHYGIAEVKFWVTVRGVIEQMLVHLDFDADQYLILKESLLDSPVYLHKTLMLPVIERGQQAHGSMPAGESQIQNPLSLSKLTIHDEPNA